MWLQDDYESESDESLDHPQCPDCGDFLLQIACDLWVCCRCEDYED